MESKPWLFSDFVKCVVLSYYVFVISPEGFGTVAMIVNFIVSLVVSRMTPASPQNVQNLVGHIRIPSGAGEASDH